MTVLLTGRKGHDFNAETPRDLALLAESKQIQQPFHTLLRKLIFVELSGSTVTMGLHNKFSVTADYETGKITSRGEPKNGSYEAISMVGMKIWLEAVTGFQPIE